MFDLRTITPAQRNAIRVHVRPMLVTLADDCRISDATMAAIQTGRATPSSASGAPVVL